MKNNFEMVSPEPKDNKARENRDAVERENHDKSTEVSAEWVLHTLETRQSYSERIPLKRDQSFDVPENVTELPGSVSQLVRSAYDMELTQKGLYDLAAEISKKYPDLQFSFKKDPKEGKWIEYSVEKKNFQIGDEAVWESGGMAHFDRPKKISAIKASPDQKIMLVFFENENTGVPLEEVMRPKR